MSKLIVILILERQIYGLTPTIVLLCPHLNFVRIPTLLFVFQQNQHE